jgi:hypothetical protein
MTSVVAAIKNKLIIAPGDIMAYINTITAIKEACVKINLTYSGDGDGRIVSAIKETEYLTSLKTILNTSHPTFIVEIGKARCWYDIRINNIPINLKLTTGNTDNAFNKEAIIYSMTGLDSAKKNMDFNTFWELCSTCEKKDIRDKSTEYHYLVVDKNNGGLLLKSIIDIHTFKTNPSNTMQINWKHEFQNIDYITPDHLFKEKIQELLKVVQTSVKQYIDTTRKFAEANIDELYIVKEV